MHQIDIATDEMAGLNVQFDDVWKYVFSLKHSFPDVTCIMPRGLSSSEAFVRL